MDKLISKDAVLEIINKKYAQCLNGFGMTEERKKWWHDILDKIDQMPVTTVCQHCGYAFILYTDNSSKFCPNCKCRLGTHG